MVVFGWITCTGLRNEFANSGNVLYKRCFVMLEKVGEKLTFYRAMHFSAYARSWDRMSSVRLFVCPSVCPSVTLVDCDHIGWKSWKLINGQLA